MEDSIPEGEAKLSFFYSYKYCFVLLIDIII